MLCPSLPSITFDHPLAYSPFQPQVTPPPYTTNRASQRDGSVECGPMSLPMQAIRFVCECHANTVFKAFMPLFLTLA